MKLKKLEIFGFKSFLEKVGIDFPAGVCAVVGPNGCGKSNVFDALRWVMGEQSVKQLRGKSMEDIIFSGAGGHSPLNMAEVSLTLANDGSMIPEELREFSEIMITRRLYRSGESAYFINKRPCRLKDVHHLFLGSGLGAKSYAIIQQGRIGAITDAGPDERRLFIEEAAGVTRYKQRKDEALRKLDATRQNLLRLNDIIAEVERQMNGLKHQAQKAKFYNRCQKQITELDVRLTLHRYTDLSDEIARADALITGLRDTDCAQGAVLQSLDAGLEKIRLAQLQKNQLISEQKASKFETRRRVDKAENDLAHFREDIERLGREGGELSLAYRGLREKNETIDQEIAQIGAENAESRTALEAIRNTLDSQDAESRSIRETLAELNRTLEADRASLLDLSAKEAQYQNIFQHTVHTQESLKRRLRLADEQEMLARKQVSETSVRVKGAQADLNNARHALEELKGRISISEKSLEESRRSLGEEVKQSETLQVERRAAVAKYATLKKMEESLEWYRDGVRAILKQSATGIGVDEGVPALGGVLGLVADMVEPAGGYETALEAVFGESLQYILVSDHAAGTGAIDYLQRSGAGRGGFVPVAAVRTVADGKGQGPDPLKRLLNHVVVKAGFESVAEAMLGHVTVAEDLTEALALYHRNGAVQTVVTKGGDLVSHQGILIGGSRENMAGILLKKRELKELKQHLSEMDQALDVVRLAQLEAEERVRADQTDLQQLVDDKNQAVRDELESEKALYKISEDLKNAQRHLDILQLEQEQLSGEETDAAAELSKFRDDLTRIQEQIKDLQVKMETVSGDILAVSAQLAAFDQRMLDCKLSQTSLSARLENGTSTLKRLTAYRRDGEARLAQLGIDIDAKKGRRIAAQEKVAELDSKLAVMYREVSELAQVLESNEREYAAILTEMRDKDQTFSDIQRQRAATLQQIGLLEGEQSQRRLRLKNMATRLEERYQRPLVELKGQFPDSPLDSQPPGRMEADLAALRQRVKTIGEVNPGAIREYETQQERFSFLVTQRDDLNQAMEDLQRVIRKINRVTQERFLATLTRVNEKLTEVFPRLFEGGSAELLLTDPNTPLDSGLEFMVHPPGKKVTRLSLLSGGEKALSAIAFIFSIFLIKPASFCLMDEIDAPLDESNVFRFNELLRIIGEQSQIVMITHNKRSMEFADILFGVTMEKKGISKIVSVSLERREAA